MRVSLISVCFLLGLAFTERAAAQSFNININDLTPDPGVSFPGAANQAGFWNGIYGNATGPRTILGLGGQTTSIQYSATGGLGSSGYNNFAGNTGDYALLLNAFADISDAAQYHFTGLAPGQYRVWSYAVEPSATSWDVSVTVPGSVEGTQHVVGPMPGNQFTQGITHAVHNITVVGDSFEIDVTGPIHHTAVNGFQVTAVPEPPEMPAFCLGLAALFAGRLHKRRFRPVHGPGG